MKATFAAQNRFASLSVIVPGTVGFLVIARTLAFYVGQDPGAALLVVAMGVGMGVGLVELWLRTRRALALEREIAGLPPQLDETRLELVRPELRELLRARIDNARPPFRPESLTPYLVGLMVMLGLLGTLLGLFDTLRGAGQALTESTNVDALRSGLSGPMRGLTRSFGCSAAGVSASAMLGLSAALVRRREGAALLAVHRYASHALRELLPGRGQADALAQLAAQGSALPKAALSLEGIAQQLTGLSERWESAHRAAAEAQKDTLERALKSVRAELTQASVGATEKLSVSIEKQFGAVAQRTASLVREHLTESARLFEGELSARREADVARQARLSEELTQIRDGFAESARLQGDMLRALVERLERSAAEQSEAHAARTAAQQKQAEAHLTALGEGVTALLVRFSDESRMLHESAAQLQAAFGARLETAGDGLAQIAQAVGKQLEARMQSEHALDQRLERSFALIEQSGRAFADAIGRQEQAVGELVLKAEGALAASAEQAASGASAALEGVVSLAQEQTERWGALAEELKATQTAHTEELSRALLAHAERLGEGLTATSNQAHQGAEELSRALLAHAERLGEAFTATSNQAHEGAEALSRALLAHAERLGEGLSGTSSLVQEAAELLKASSVEMTAVAEMFASSVERQREAASSWLESLGELEGAVERAGRGAAADALGDQLASTQEVFARQLQFQRELFEQLRNLRAPSAVHGEHDVSA